MASVLHRSTLQYLSSVNTPEYPVVNWIHNPDMSGVEGVPQKYWKLFGDTPIEMSASEKLAVDTIEMQQQEDGEMSEVESGVLRRLVLLLLDEINILRNAAGLSLRTIEQLKTAMRNK